MNKLINNLIKYSKGLLLLLLYFFVSFYSIAEPKSTKSKVYIIENIEVEGNINIDASIILQLSGLKNGDIISIPSNKINDAVTRIWEQKIVDDISIEIKKINGDNITLLIKISEKSMISDYLIKGISTTEEEAILEKIGDIRGVYMSNFFKKNIKKNIKNYFYQKGYLLTEVEIKENKDPENENSVIIEINVIKNSYQKVHKIYVKGNTVANLNDIKTKMIFTKERSRPSLIRKSLFKIFTGKAFLKGGSAWKQFRKSEIIDRISSIMSNLTGTSYKEKTFEQDKEKLVKDIYFEKGYLDAHIAKSVVKQYDSQSVDIFLEIYEGPQYRIGKVSWVGNKLFSDKILNHILQIKPGMVYNKNLIERNIFFPQNSVHSLYKNDGFLFSTINVKKTKFLNNKVDLLINVYEGNRATINNVFISGTKITKDRIIRRYITTLPGDKYTNFEILRSRHQLAKTGLVDERKLQIIPLPNQDNNTTDIEYIIKEKIDIKASLSAGYGIYGWQGKFNIGLNNFSLRNLFTFNLPMGDAQSINIGWEKSSKHSNWTFMFIDPWIGGARPWQLSTSFNYSYQSEEKEDETIINTDPLATKNKFGSRTPIKISGYSSYISTKGASISVGKRLPWPADTTFYTGITFNRHDFKEYKLFRNKNRVNGYSMDLFLDISFERDTSNSTFYPFSGHTIFIGTKLTPPWSKMFERFSDSNEVVNSWSEFHQTKLSASIFQRLFGELVVYGKIEFGLLGSYSTNSSVGPYKRYCMGGDGMLADYYNSILSQTPVKLRGYSNPSKDTFGMPQSSNGFFGGVFYNKFTLEIRHPISLDFAVPIYLLAFFEAGNTWASYREIKFLDFFQYKSYGLGFRAIVPMIRQFGIDFGFGINRKNKNLNPEIHFTIGG